MGNGEKNVKNKNVKRFADMKLKSVIKTCDKFVKHCLKHR